MFKIKEICDKIIRSESDNKKLKKNNDEEKYGKIQFAVEKQQYKEFFTIAEAQKWGMEYYAQWAREYKAVFEDSKKILKDNIITIPVEAYCGHFIDELIKMSKENKCVQEKGFMSTSLLKSAVMRNFKDNSILKIYVDEKSIGLYVNVVAKRDEEELLLCPNGYLGLINNPYIDQKSGKMIYECKLFYKWML